MTEFDHSQLGPDELKLSGRLQVETAISVLSLTGVNPQAEEQMKALRYAHELTTFPGAMDDLNVHLIGGITGAIKADIATSALMVEANQTLPPHIRNAASGLLEILGIVK